jgi:muramoyltetrapeptide carboxypeptidase
MLKDFTPSTPSFNYESFFSTITNTDSPQNILNPPQMPLITKVPGIVIGPIVGGNVSSLIDSLGIPYQLDTRGKILFLEDVAEAITRMYRKLTHLQRTGLFDDCLGIIMGECTNCAVTYDINYNQLIDMLLKPLGKPLLTGLATGHGIYKVTIPLGAKIRLDTEAKSITIIEPVVS